MKYFLFNHSGCKNHGCEAIIRGTVNILDNADKNRQYVLSSFDSQSDSIIQNVESRQFKWKPLSRYEKARAIFEFKIKHSEKYTMAKRYSNVIKQAVDCDICLSVGGDTYCYGNNIGIQVLTECLKKSGKKVVLWGASIGEEDLTEEKLESLRLFDAIFTRESLTYNLLKEKNANDKIFLNSDPAFCMEREEMDLPEGFTKENSLGINLSPLAEKYNPKLKEIAEIFIEYILENTTLKILFVPHVVEDGNNDYEYMLPLVKKFEKTGRAAILSPDLNAKQYKGCISKLRFFIGSRTHSTIAAYSSGVPTFVLGYSVKSRGIATDLFGDEKYVADIRNIEDAQTLIDGLNMLIEDEDEIKKTLMRKIPLQIKSAMEMGDLLLKL